MLTLEAGFNKFFSLGKNWYSNIYLNGKLRLPFEQPFINQRGLGYGDNYLRGLEYYVIDGVATALVKTTLKKKIVSFSIPRWSRSSNSAERALSRRGQWMFLSGPKFAAWVSHAVFRGSPLATDGQFTCTTRVPAWIRRRAVRTD